MEPEREAAKIDGATAIHLMQPLLPVQVDLLKLTWDPIARADMWKIPPDWPVWDYVARELYRKHPDLDDATAVLDSLPRMSQPTPWRPHRPYGLVWLSSQAIRPDSGERVGLSIAGLAALAAHQLVPPDVPDRLARLIAQLADWENGLTAKPNEIAREDVALSCFTSWFTTPTITKQYVFSDRALAELLQHEYAPTIVSPHDSDTGHKVQLGRHFSLRQYRNTSSTRLPRAGSRRRCGADRACSLLVPVDTRPDLRLPRLVLAADPEWPNGMRLTTAPDLQSAGALSATVTDQHDFLTALSGLCTVIDQLTVPHVPAEELDNMANGTERGAAQRTVNRLQRWLTSRLTDSGDMPRVMAAISFLRDVRSIRVEGQHRSTSTRNNAIKAQRRLGLPDIISDCPAGWHLIQSRLAGALDVIRQEVQAAPHSPNDHSTIGNQGE